MDTLIREERYISYIGTADYVLRVEELIRGPEPWPASFRIRLPASLHREAKTVYGGTARDAVEKAVEHLRISQQTPGRFM